MPYADAIRALLADAKPARKEVQRVAKLCKVRANSKTTVILDELRALLPGEDEEMDDQVEPANQEAAQDDAMDEPATEPTDDEPREPDEDEPEPAAEEPAVATSPPRRRSSAEDVAQMHDTVEVAAAAAFFSDDIPAASSRLSLSEDRRKTVLAARACQSARKAQEHNRTRTNVSMSSFGERGPRHRVQGGAKAVPRGPAPGQVAAAAAAAAAGAAPGMPPAAAAPSVTFPPASAPEPGMQRQPVTFDLPTDRKSAAAPLEPIDPNVDTAPTSNRKPPKSSSQCGDNSRDDRRRASQSAQKNKRASAVMDRRRD
ncbi:hypothetical protein M885DRAFT_587903 [Pelagophyceae sp. CCMP2097]|nr:hypothetical protein M885DRAFT_587903 [Pelagophyceae sp. CCMP2097]